MLGGKTYQLFLLGTIFLIMFYIITFLLSVITTFLLCAMSYSKHIET